MRTSKFTSNTLPRARRFAVAVLAILTVVLALQRAHTYHEPLERDITTYSVVAHEVLAGRLLYSDLWDNKSPLVFATYAAGQLIAGHGPGAIFLLGVCAAVGTLFGVYAAAATLSGSGAAGLWAAVAWTLVSADQSLQANQPNLEVFINVCLVWLLVVFAADRSRPVAMGVLAAAASLYKPVVVPTLVFWHLAHVLHSRRRRAALLDVAISVATFAGVWALVAGYFAVSGRSAVFWQAVLTYNQAFAGNLTDNLASGLVPSTLLPRVLWCTLPLIALAPLGIYALLRAQRVHAVILWLAYATGIAAAIALPGKFWAHYYQLWLPVLAIGGGIGIQALGIRFESLALPLRRAVVARSSPWARIAGAAVLLSIAAYELPSYGQSAEGWSRAKYGDIFVDSKHTAALINGVLLPGETFFVWGDESGLYYYTQRPPPSGIFYIFPVIVAGPLGAALTRRVAESLERTRPELLVMNVRYAFSGMQSHPVVALLGQDYYRWPEGPERGPFHLYIRQGGALEGRVLKSGGGGN